MPSLARPQINLYSKHLPGAAEFYRQIGFVETFRTPETGPPVHIEMTLEGFTLGIATVEAAQMDHQLAPSGEGRWIELVFWTEDADAALVALVKSGAPIITKPHDFLDGQLRAAWTADPDGNPIQLVQRKGPSQ